MAGRPQVVTWKVTVPAAGTPVNLQPATNSRPTFASLRIQALFSNTDDVYVMGTAGSRGNSYVLPSPVSYGSIPEVQLDRIPIEAHEIRIDADVNDEGVIVLAEPTDP